VVDGWREWTVAGALVESDAGLLLVRNVRRGGFEDWSTPGGVIDDDDATLLDGLAREVEEETGLRVTEWHGPVYEVHAVAPDMGWHMRCEVHLASCYSGELRIDDPDGIVVEASFVPDDRIPHHLDGCATWVREPLLTYVAERWAAGADPIRRFSYEIRGTYRDALEVVRHEPQPANRVTPTDRDH
jgi:8-oxo-dGTP diphosphatase